MARVFVLLSAVCFGTTGTAQALGPDAAPITAGAALTATGLGMLALGERPGAVAAVGAALVLAGLRTLAAPARRPTRRLASVAA